MSKVQFETVTIPIIPPRDEKTCEHHWSWYTYVINGMVTTKKLCFYCKKVEDV